MATTRTFDELKSLKKEIDDSLIRKTIMDFFDDMEVDDVEQRTRMAINLERVVADVLMLTLVAEITREELIEQLIEEYSQVVISSGYRPNYAHIERVAETLVDNTLDNADDDYMTSAQRFIVIACTETNNAANYDEYLEAIENGMTEKIWLTEKDNRVRNTHKVLDSKIIPIMELFDVGDAQMRFPCDEELAYDFPEEIVNCRCHIEYQ